MTTSRLVAGVVAMLAATALVGCTAAAPDRTPDPGASSTQSPTPSAQQVDLTKPASQIPGTCDQFVSTASATSILGLPTSVVDVPLAAATWQSGRLFCRWEAPGPKAMVLDIRRHADLLLAAPNGYWAIEGSPAGVGADSSGIECMDQGGNPYCEIDVRVGDYRFTTYASAADGMAIPTLRASMVSAATSVVSRLRSQPLPSEWTAPRGAWPGVIDCERLGTVGGFTQRDVTGVDYGSEIDMPDDVARLGGRSACFTGSAISEFAAGGGWALADASSDSEAIDVGADDARISCLDDGACTVEARIGVNLVTVDLPNGFEDYPLSRDEIVSTAKTVVATMRKVYP